jgi:hypothetical protein
MTGPAPSVPDERSDAARANEEPETMHRAKRTEINRFNLITSFLFSFIRQSAFCRGSIPNGFFFHLLDIADGNSPVVAASGHRPS